jgi:hypothetical protein
LVATEALFTPGPAHINTVFEALCDLMMLICAGPGVNMASVATNQTLVSLGCPVSFGFSLHFVLCCIVQVGADAELLASYCSRILGWVSDFGSESEIPTVPDLDLEEFVREAVIDAEGLITFVDDERRHGSPLSGHRVKRGMALQ